MKLLKTILTPLAILTLAGCGGSDSTTDMSAPVVADVVSNSKIVETLQPQLSGNCSGDDNVYIYVDGKKIEQEATCSNGSYSLTLDENLTHGRHCFDVAQNNSIRSPQTCVFTGRPFVVTYKSDNPVSPVYEPDNPGISEDNQVRITTSDDFDYNFHIDWGDGTSDANVTNTITHTYSSIGTYDIKINGIYPYHTDKVYLSDADMGPSFGYYHVYAPKYSDRDKLIAIKQWGSIQWQSMEDSFAFCIYLQVNASDSPDLSSVTSTLHMFEGVNTFNTNMNDWNVSNVTNMYGMFRRANFNQDISNWDVSNVTDMSHMFYATPFNQDIGDWDVSSVVKMRRMFEESHFNQDISNWDMSSITDLFDMLNGEHPIKFSTQNYDKLLISLSNQNLNRDILFITNTFYSSIAANARQKLIDDFNWSIFDRGLKP